jgi:PAS domain S-box-containing protein
VPDLRMWLLVVSLLILFLLDVRLPEVVLLPFMYVPVVAAATFTGPRQTGVLAVFTVSLGLVAGGVNGDLSDDDYWYRLAAMVVAAGLAVYLAHQRASRERRLVDGEHRLRLMLDNTADVVLRSDPDGRLLWASPSLATVFGWDPDHVVGTEFVLTLPGDRAAARDALTDAIGAATAVYSHRSRALRADGSPAWVDTRSTILRTPAGSVESVVSSVRDVTAQVEAEQQLATSELRYRLLAENSTDPVFLTDTHGRIQWASPAVLTQFGYPPAELVGRDRIDLVQFEDRRIVMHNRWLASHGEHVRSEERFLLPSGAHRWVSVALRPFVDQAGDIVGHVTTLRDIHEDVLMREALARSERTFRLAMNGAAQGMAVVGLHHRLLQVNDALADLVSRDKAWLTQHDEDDLLHEEEVELTRQVRDRLLTGHVDQETRISRLVTADGCTVRITHGLGLLRDEHGLPLFFVCQYTPRQTARSR